MDINVADSFGGRGEGVCLSLFPLWTISLSALQFDVNTYARAWHIAGPLYYTNSTECRLAIFGGNVHWDGFVGKRRNIGDIRIVTFGRLV